MSKFLPGMTWNNHGEWEIDHILPLMYNNPTTGDIIQRLHWTNTQPMWKQDNIEKGNRYILLNNGTQLTLSEYTIYVENLKEYNSSNIIKNINQ